MITKNNSVGMMVLVPLRIFIHLLLLNCRDLKRWT